MHRDLPDFNSPHGARSMLSDSMSFFLKFHVFLFAPCTVVRILQDRGPPLTLYPAPSSLAEKVSGREDDDSMVKGFREASQSGECLQYIHHSLRPCRKCVFSQLVAEQGRFSDLHRLARSGAIAAGEVWLNPADRPPFRGAAKPECWDLYLIGAALAAAYRSIGSTHMIAGQCSM